MVDFGLDEPDLKAREAVSRHIASRGESRRDRCSIGCWSRS